ncbi:MULTISPECIES: hypothetical protein, partial [Oscillospiraceae]
GLAYLPNPPGDFWLEFPIVSSVLNSFSVSSVIPAFLAYILLYNKASAHKNAAERMDTNDLPV